MKGFKKRMCAVGLVVASVFAGVAAPMAVNMMQTENVYATQSRTGNFNKNYSSSNDPGTLMVNIAKAQLGKTQSQLGYTEAWCADFVSDCAILAGQKDAIPQNGSVYQMEKAVLNSGGYKINENDVKPGDLVIFRYNNEYRHVGIVEYRGSDGKVHVLEGNVSVSGASKVYGGTAIVNYKRTYETGRYNTIYYIRPNYKGVIPPYDPWNNELKDKEVRIDDGYYVIQSRLGYSEHNLDVAGAGTAHGTNIGIWNAFGAHSGQIFKVFRTYYDSYAMESLNTGRYVSTENDTVGAANCILGDGNASMGQHFKLFDAGDGFVYVSNNHKYFLDIYNANNTMGNNVQLWKYNGSDAQKWKFTRVSGCKLVDIPEGDYLIYSKVKNRVLNVNANKVENGSNINIYDPFTPTTPQGRIFTVSKDGNFATKIINKAANRSINTDGNLNQSGGNVILWDSNKNYGQNWYIEDAGDGYVYIRNLWGYYLDIDHDSSGAYENGRNVQVWSFHGQDNEKWKLVRYYAVTGVNLNTANKTLTEGTTGQLTATIAPSNANNKNLSWSSSNTSVAIVDNNGKVTAKSPGTATITVKAADSGRTATCTVTVKSKTTAVTGVKLNKTKAILKKGSGLKLTPTISPSNATDKKVTWSSSNTKVATVDANGNVKAVNHGIAKITAKTNNGKTATCEVRVNFIDVTYTKAWYYKPVYWAADKGIATGTNGNFIPAGNCTREQAVTFLWRMAGSPNPKSMTSKFSDVKNTKRYSYKAIMWGSEKGIITGTKGKFNPTGTCTREQIVTMIWRLAGGPNPKTTTSKFKDVTNKKSYSYKAILWANEKGIATGSNGKFSPTEKCKRRDIVTFIYRYKN